MEGEMGGKMRALPPILEQFPHTGLSVGGLGHYSSLPSVLFGSIIASRFSQSCLIVGEQ